MGHPKYVVGLKMRVVVADDSEMIRIRVARALEQIPGLEIVGHARTGAEVMKLVNRLRPHMVVLDLMMPQVSGYEVLCRVKRVKPRVLVMILTNFAEPYWERKCKKAGADFFLDKSSEFESMVSICTRLAAECR